MEAHVDRLVEGLQDVLREALLGVYLHGSAVLGGLRPRSDIDVIAVSRRRTSLEEKRRLAELVLSISVRGSIAQAGLRTRASDLSRRA